MTLHTGNAPYKCAAPPNVSMELSRLLWVARPPAGLLTLRRCPSSCWCQSGLRVWLVNGITSPHMAYRLQENEWDPDIRYDCPDGFHHASTAQVRSPC